MRIADGNLYINVERVDKPEDEPLEEFLVGAIENCQTDNPTLIAEWALWLEKKLAQPFGRPGHRNCAAVNTCCLLRALGIKHPFDWINMVDDNLREKYAEGILRMDDFPGLNEAFERVDPSHSWQTHYLDLWDDGKGGVISYILD